MDLHLQSGNNDSSFLCTPPPKEYIVSKLPHEMHSIPQSFPDQKAIVRRQIMKERIRQEILLQEMAERRMLEVEVRREIELERLMEMRRIQMERLSLLAATNQMANQVNQLALPRSSGSFVQDAAELTFSERSQSHLLKKNTVVPAAESSLFPKSEKILPSEVRKTPEKFLVQTEKQWGCAICKVHAPCESGLKAHLQGKKHKAKLAPLVSKKTITDHKEAPFPSFKKTNPSKEPLLTSQKSIQYQAKKPETLQMKGALASGHWNEKQPLMKGTSTSGPVKKLWCPICKVMCNSETMLENHRGGKKHQASLELMKASNTFAIEATKEVEGAVAEGHIKTKTPEKILVVTEKKWGCDLCKVHAPCESGLKAHLQGKKHRAKEALLGSKNITDHKEEPFPCFEKTNPIKEPLLISQKTIHSQPKKNETYDARLVVSETMPEDHHGGKMHQTSVKLKKAVNIFSIEAAKQDAGVVAERLIKVELGARDPLSWKPRIMYSRDFLLALSVSDVCKKLPTDLHNSVLSDLEHAATTVSDSQGSVGNVYFQGPRRGEHGFQSLNRLENSNSYARGNSARWDSRSSGSNDREGDLQSGRESFTQACQSPPGGYLRSQKESKGKTWFKRGLEFWYSLYSEQELEF